MSRNLIETEEESPKTSNSLDSGFMLASLPSEPEALLLVVAFYLVTSTYWFANSIYQDIQLLHLKPMSEWLFDPLFWKVAIELSLLAGGLYIVAATPVGPSLIGAAIGVSIAFGIASLISSALSPKKTSTENLGASDMKEQLKHDIITASKKSVSNTSSEPSNLDSEDAYKKK